MIRAARFLTLASVLALALFTTSGPLTALPVQAPAPVPIASGAPGSFVPRPDSITVQKSSFDPELGNTLVVVSLPNDEVERLAKLRGRTDLFLVGGEGVQVVFRDDGKEGDALGRDGQYSAIAEVDHDQLAARASAETSLESAGATNNVPVFDQRTLTGTTSTTPFDISAFNAGEAVAISPSGSISSAFAGNEAVHQGGEGNLLSMSAAAVVPGTNQFQDRVLMIKDVAVVTDPARTFDPCTGAGTPMGVWTFGHLMTEMANQAATGINPSTFVETWLLHWASNQTINSFNVPQRLDINTFIADWRAASGGGDLDLSIAPFRLLSINPRLDLRTTVGGGSGYGATSSGVFLDAGEARFIFGVVLPDSYDASEVAFFNEVTIPPASNDCQATPFSTILEFRVPKCKCEDVRAWAKAWIELDNHVPGTADYNDRLEKLTHVFTDHNANKARPNGSAIGQVRSNEITMHPGNFLWEIREFQLRQKPWSLLLESTTADTPEDVFNQTVTFGNFVLDTISGAAGPPVPLFYPLGSAQNFLGGNPRTPAPPNTFHWGAPNLNLANPAEDNGRHLVSLGTCNGCHAGETRTNFVQVDPATPGLPATLSQFLTGTVPPVLDPAGSGTQREFDDLARREVDINRVARMACGSFHAISIAGSAILADSTASPVSLAFEDFLRQPILQVH